MDFIGEQPGTYPGVAFHDLGHFRRNGVKDADSRHAAPVVDRADNRQFAFGAELKVPAAMLPNDLLGARLLDLSSPMEDDDGVAACFREPLAHHLIGYRRHALP